MGLEFSAATKQELEQIFSHYVTRGAALLPVLYLAQREFGYVSLEAMEYVAGVVGLSPARVYEVATFYTMFNKQPVGKYFIQVCTNISCALRGGMDLFAYLSKRLGIAEGQTTKDGRFTLTKVECLGACGNAPMMQVNDDYYEDLTPARVDELLKSMT
ncbi:MAG: NADH-quinone oxidoreductase subunit NuoE [Deltaproteobacteria bacterium]